MKKILIIGGCGYIGSALKQYLDNFNYYVETVDLELFGNYNSRSNNICVDYDNLDIKYLIGFDVVILTAANSSVNLCNDLFDTYNNNIHKFVNLLKKLDKQKFIYASSSCVYVTHETEEKNEQSLLNPVDNLTLSKTTIDHLASLSDIEFYGLRFGSVNGWSPNTRLDLMVNAMTISALKNNEVKVFNKNMHRPILSINDLCRGVLKIIESEKDYRGIYNMASFNEKIETIALGVSSLTNSAIIYEKNSFTYDFKISSERFIKTFNYEFQDTLEDIVKSLINSPINPKWCKRELSDVNV